MKLLFISGIECVEDYVAFDNLSGNEEMEYDNSKWSMAVERNW